jgi:flagella basal body P-ring formation protein FlgA
MMTKFRRAILFAACLPAPALAQPVQDIGALEARLLTALDANIGEPGGPVAPIDRRLKLTPCPKPVAIDPPALGAVALRCPAIGWRIRVPLVREAQAAVAVKAAPVVRRGDPVEIRAESESFSVSAQAIAQEDGAQGQRIRVKTDPKSAVIFAEVVDMGIVRVAGFK